MTPAQCDITIYHNCIVREAFELTEDDGTPLDITGWTCAAQVRKSAGGELVAEFTVNVDESESVITFEFDIETSDAIPAGQYAWDALITKTPGEPERFLVGTITKQLTVTEL